MRVLSVIVFICLIEYTIALFGIGRSQSVAVKGRLVCNGKPEAGVVVKLYDQDSLADSKMGEAKTDSDGSFSFAGTGREITTIDPKVNFYHNCENSAVRCARKFTIKIPKSYVSSGSSAERTYNFQTMELAGKYGDESHDCIH